MSKREESNRGDSRAKPTLMRVMFINYGDDEVTIEVSAREGSIRVFELPSPTVETKPETDEIPEVEVDAHAAGKSRKFTQPPNTIYGVSHDNTDNLAIRNPRPRDVVVHVVANKDPWPKPPPPPPGGGWNDPVRHEKRYRNFLKNLGDETDTPVQYVLYPQEPEQ